MIVVRDLIYEYPNARALNGISLEVRPKTITALVGPNGAGKTTLLCCLAALETPYSGDVLIEGQNTRDEPRRIHERLGYLPDFFGLYDDLSVRRCLLYAARSRGLSEGDALVAVERAAARVQLSDRLDQKAGELSRGLRQRLAIGQSIVHEPGVLLLDEPAAGLDPQARRDLSGLLLALRDQGMTLVVSSHILAELEDYCSEMIIIDHGLVSGGGSIAVRAEEKRQLLIVLAKQAEGLPGFLATRSDVAVVEADAIHARIEFAGDLAARAALLRALVEAQFDVAGFSESGKSLEDLYFAQTRGNA